MSLNAYVQSFMEKFPQEGLTFDDVSLITQYADFLPDHAEIKSRLTRNITVNIPFVSAAMDTVTESPMAIAMALLGGIGIIHKNLTAKRQAEHVARVKHYLNGLIRAPIVFHDTDTLETVHKTKAQKGFTFSGFPILDADERVVGILTAADIKFASNNKAKVTEMMTSSVISAPGDTTLQEAYTLMKKHRIGKLPLVDKEGKLAGLYSFCDVRTLVENVEPLYNRDSRYRLRAGAAIGPNDQDRVAVLAKEDVDVVIIDTAHGHSKGVIEMIKWVKKHYPDIDVVAGVGIPQITAIYECARALQGSIPIIADGGIRHSGDVPKAIVAGADSIMAGSLFAGTDESPGEKIIHQGRQYVIYRGMGSLGAMREGAASRERYGQSNIQEDELVPQGIEGILSLIHI